MRIPLVVALVAFVAVSCDQQPVGPESDTGITTPTLKAQPSHNHFSFTDEFSYFVECGGVDEVVDFSITGKVQWQHFFDANGGEHLEGVLVAKGKGYGQTSGAKWIYSEVWPTTMHVGPNTEYPYTYSDVYINKWQGTGGMPSWNDWFVTKYTVNANGVVTVDFASHRYVCDGL